VYEDGEPVESTKSLSTRLTGRTGGHEYRYKVIAENEAGRSAFSDERTIKATTAPGRPTGLGIAKVAPSGVGKPETIRVKWDSVSSGGGANLRYDYELRMGGRTSGTKTTSDTSADVNVSDWDVNLWGSEFTLVVTARTDIKSGESESTKTEIGWGDLPSNPTNLQVTLDSVETPTAVTAQWVAPVNDGGAGTLRYEFQWFAERGRNTSVRQTEATSTTIQLSELDGEPGRNDRQIRFLVRAVNDKGASDWVEQTVTVPARQPDPEPTPTPAPGG
jgi:large repetitive protein